MVHRRLARRAGAAAVLGVALLMATPMMNTSQAGSAGNDIVGVFFLLASVAFVLAGERPRRRDSCWRRWPPGSRSASS